MKIPEGWVLKELQSFAPVIDCKHRTPSYVDTGVPIISPGDIGWNGLNLQRARRVSKSDADSLMDHCTVEEGDLIVGRNQKVGIAALVDESTDIVIGQDTVLVKSSNASPKYLQNLFASDLIKRQIYRLLGGSTFGRVNLKDFRKLKILLPPIQQRTHIAEILGTWDRAIAAVEALITASEAQKKALMQQLLTGKRRLPGFEGDWQEFRLGDVANCLDNRRVPLNRAQRSDRQGVVPYYGANGVLDYIDNHIFDQDLVLLAEDGGYFDEFATRPIAQFITGKSWVNNHAHILEAKKQTTEKWLYYSLVHKNIMAFVNAGTRAKLNKSDMLSIPFLMPEKDEQHKVIEVLDGAKSETNKLNFKLQTLKIEKAALMQQLLTGKRRVNLTEEAA